jgi:hypothetical protein
LVSHPLLVFPYAKLNFTLYHARHLRAVTIAPQKGWLRHIELRLAREEVGDRVATLIQV